MSLRSLACLLMLPLLLAPGGAHAQERRSGAQAKPAAAAKKSAPRGSTSWYALRITRGDTGVIVAHLWSAGRNLRAQAVLGGVPILQLVSGEWYYVIDELRKVGVAVRRSPKALEADRTAGARRPFGNEAADLLKRGAEPVREEEVGGRKARVLRLTDRLGRHEVWVTDDESQLPIRIDSIDRETGAHIVSDYVDWLSQLQLPDSFFEPDPRVQLERIEYEEYLRRASKQPVGPAPVLFADLLHGS